MRVTFGIYNRYFFRDIIFIIAGSMLYAASTVLFIFPHLLLLGGTSGISVILEGILNISPGTILMVINLLLTVVAFIILGRDMAYKTLIGSLLTTVFIGLFEKLWGSTAFIKSPLISVLLGAALIAVASGVMFYVDSSSGGTDIIALLVKKFSTVNIGKALLITDISIVIAGGIISGIKILIFSFVGLLIKTLGIDFVIFLIKKSKRIILQKCSRIY